MSEWPATASSDVNMQAEYAKSVARTAFVWAYPMVNMINRRASVTHLPEPGKAFGTLPAAPTNYVAMLSNYIDPGQNFIACPNQDVVYGLGFTALDQSPVVLQVPDFGDRFWVYALYDQRTDQIGHLGKPYGSKPGFYLLVGPDWEGQTPKGITAVLHSPTNLANIIPRIFMDLNRYSLGTKNKSLQYNDDGSLTLYVGNKSPGDQLETNWIPAPKDEFSLYIRAYWGKEGITGGSWQPSLVQRR